MDQTHSKLRGPGWRRWAAVLGALTLLATACGSEGTEDEATGEPVGADETADGNGTDTEADGEAGGQDGSDEVVKIGLLVPLTGEYAGFGESWLKAAEMFVAEVNELNVLPNGAVLETVIEDEGTGESEESIRNASRMIDSEGVVAIVGPTSGPVLALEPVAIRTMTPVISSSAGSVALNKIGGEYIFRTVPSDDDDRIVITKLLEAEEAEGLAMFVENSASPISTASSVREEFESIGGEITAEVRVNPGESSYRTAVGEVLNADPNWILCSCTQQTGTSILKELAASGYDGERIVTPDLATEDAIAAVGEEIMQGAYAVIAAADDESTEYAAYADKYRNEFGEAPETFSSNTYDALALVVLAMIASDSTDGADIAEHLASVSSGPGTKVTSVEAGAQALEAGEEIDYDGPSGPIEFDETGTAASSYAILQASGSTYEQVKFYSAEEIAAAK